MNNIKRILLLGKNDNNKRIICAALSKELKTIVLYESVIKHLIIESQYENALDIFSKNIIDSGHYCICSLEEPSQEIGELFYYDSFVIWVNIIESNPVYYNYKISESPTNMESLIRDILIEYNYFCVDKSKDMIL